LGIHPSLQYLFLNHIQLDRVHLGSSAPYVAISPVSSDKYHYIGRGLMKSKFKILAVLVAIASSWLAACAASQPAAGIAGVDLTGVWKQDEVGGRCLQLNEDGTYSAATELVWLEQAPREIGQFRLEGNLLTFITSNESYDCKGQSGSYQVELTEEDQLQLVLQDDGCQLRANGHPGTWSRVEP
jgi:hypothetical protein